MARVSVRAMDRAAGKGSQPQTANACPGATDVATAAVRQVKIGKVPPSFACQTPHFG